MQKKPSTKSPVKSVPVKPARKRAKEGVYLVKMVYVPDDVPDVTTQTGSDPKGQCEARESEE